MPKYDSDGFLINFSEWNINIANEIATEENINMLEQHWMVIEFLREYYKQHKKSPAIRTLVKGLKDRYDSNIVNSLYLQSLFPVSPAVQAARIAGLPKPKRCI